MLIRLIISAHAIASNLLTALNPEEERKIRQTGNVQLETKTEIYETAKLSLEGLVSKNNGYYTNKQKR